MKSQKREVCCLPNHIIEFYGLIEKEPINSRVLYVYSKGNGKSIEFRLFLNNVIDAYFISMGKEQKIKYGFDFSNEDDLKKLNEYISRCDEM